jgi:hypothetical protein
MHTKSGGLHIGESRVEASMVDSWSLFNNNRGFDHHSVIIWGVVENPKFKTPSFIIYIYI